MKPQVRWRLSLLALFVAAALVRVPGLGQSLWYDEAFTVVHFTSSPWAALSEQQAANNHPLASLLTWAVLPLSGGREWVLRLPFLLLGALACPALAWSVARVLPRARNVGLAAGGLLALAPQAVDLSQQVRGYGGLLLAAALLPGVLAGALRGTRRAPLWLGAVVALGLLSHLTFGLALFGAALVVATWRTPATGAEEEGRSLAGLGLAGGTLVGLALQAPLVGRTWRYLRRALTEGDPGTSASFGLPQLVACFGGELAPAEVSGPLADCLAALLLVAAAASAFLLLHLESWGQQPVGPATARAAEERRWGLLLTLPAAVPLVLLLALGLLGAPGYARFAACALPPGLGLAVVLLVRRPPGASGFDNRLLFLLALVLSAWGVRAQAGLPRQDLRGAVLLARQAGVSELALANELGAGVALYAGDLPLVGVRTEPSPRAVLDPFPRFTPPERAEELATRLGPPLVVPGRVTEVLLYLAAPSPTDAPEVSGR